MFIWVANCVKLVIVTRYCSVRTLKIIYKIKIWKNLLIVSNHDSHRRIELTDGFDQSYQAWIADKCFDDDSHQLINFPFSVLLSTAFNKSKFHTMNDDLCVCYWPVALQAFPFQLWLEVERLRSPVSKRWPCQNTWWNRTFCFCRQDSSTTC